MFTSGLVSNETSAGVDSSAVASLPPNGNRIPQLDGVRGLAILMVLIWHFYVCVPTANTFLNVELKHLLCLAWTGVDLFFVLSGFLIGGILIDHKYDRDYFKVFYVRRVCRIFPLYFLLLATYAIRSRVTGEPGGGQLPLWPYPFFLQSIFIATRGTLGNFWLGGTWSLAVEEQFYLAFPLLVRICKERLLPHVFIVLILLAPLFRIVLWSMSRPLGLAAFVLLPCRMDELALGALGAWMLRRQRTWLESHLSWLYTYLCLFGAGFAILSLRNWGLLTPEMTSFGHTWVGILYLLVILIGVLCTNPLAVAAYNFPPLRVLGIFSYSIYLSHPIVLRQLSVLICHHEPELYDLKDVLTSSLALLVTLSIAAISWFLIEKPIIGFGHKWKYKPSSLIT